MGRGMAVLASTISWLLGFASAECMQNHDLRAILLQAIRVEALGCRFGSYGEEEAGGQPGRDF